MSTAFATESWHDTTLPLADEPFVSAWEQYVTEAERDGAEAVLRRFVQLRFPIAPGISTTTTYQAAVRRGVMPHHGDALFLRRPNDIRIWLHETAAGRIPVLVIPERDDFTALIRAFVHRNEPVAISPSMGACMVAGYNNWDRVRALRSVAAGSGPPVSEERWQLLWRTVIPRKALYQDRFILLSTGSYSDVSATAFSLPHDEWLRLSLTIRLEHECAHYFTRRLFGMMRNTVHDELLADYAGITAACGRYRADWFLRFMGLEAFPLYRQGGRLEQYGETASLRDTAASALRRMVHDASRQLEAFDAELTPEARSMLGRAAVLAAIADRTIDEIAGATGSSLLRAAYERMTCVRC